MATTSSFNKKSSAVKRILSEARELSQDTSTEYQAAPLEDNIFEWHFTFRGPTDTAFSSGKYHGKITLPSEFPFRPPSVMILTPNGRWELNKKICLTFTGFHEEQWLPAWGIRTAVLGVQQFMSARERAAVGIGSLETNDDERLRLAKSSLKWACPICKKSNEEILPDPDPSAGPRKAETLPEGLIVETNLKPKSSSDATTSSVSGTINTLDQSSTTDVESAAGIEETTKEAGAVQAAKEIESSATTATGAGLTGGASLTAASIPDVLVTGTETTSGSGSRGEGSNSTSSSTVGNTSLSTSTNSFNSSPSTPSNTTSQNTNLNSERLATASPSISGLRQRPVPNSSVATSSTTSSNQSSNSTAIQSNPLTQRQTQPQPSNQNQTQNQGGNVAVGGNGTAALTGVRLEIYEQEMKIATYDRAILSVCLCLVVLIVRVLFA